MSRPIEVDWKAVTKLKPPSGHQTWNKWMLDTLKNEPAISREPDLRSIINPERGLSNHQPSRPGRAGCHNVTEEEENAQRA